MPLDFVVAARIGTEWVEVLRKSDVTDWTTETFVCCLFALQQQLILASDWAGAIFRRTQAEKQPNPNHK